MENDNAVARVPSTTGDVAPQGAANPQAEAKAPAMRLASLPAQELASVLDKAIERYGAGTSVYVIANDLGVEHTTLYRHLVKHRESEWRDAKVSRALAELEESEEALKTAPDALALSRARERCRAAQWQLERLMRRIYGQDAPTSAQAVQINISLRRDADSPRRDPDITVVDHNP